MKKHFQEILHLKQLKSIYCQSIVIKLLKKIGIIYFGLQDTEQGGLFGGFFKFLFE